MLAFKILTSENKDDILSALTCNMPDADTDYLLEVADSLCCDGECDYALAVAHGCLLIRIFDEKYMFVYPLPLCEGADALSAAAELRSYAVKEEIPLIYIDVPREELGGLISLYRHANADALDPDRESYTVRIMSEASLFTEQVNVSSGLLSLTNIYEDDDCEYARLCKDEKTNEHWGYDYRSDEADPADSYFREEAEREYSRGVALCLAVREGDIFVGEATLYGFDLLGGCECAVRILPEYRGRSFATAALRMLASLARDMGILNLYATVLAANEASLGLCRKIFDEEEKQGEKVKFYLEL